MSKTTLKVEAGKSYSMKAPGYYKIARIHVDHIVSNPINDSWDGVLIVMRVWLKHKKRWHHMVEPYWLVAHMNDWKWGDTKQCEVVGCNKPVDEGFAPCCSLECWNEQYEGVMEQYE